MFLLPPSGRAEEVFESDDPEVKLHIWQTILNGFFFPITHVKDLFKIPSEGFFTFQALFPTFIHFYEPHLQETTTIHTHIYT